VLLVVELATIAVAELRRVGKLWSGALSTTWLLTSDDVAATVAVVDELSLMVYWKKGMS
jgi:hypothetical protein